MTETAMELNQKSFNSGWWYIDIPIQSDDICLEYMRTEDGESLMRTLRNRAEIIPCELEETSLIREHPLLEQKDIEMVFRLKCKFGGRVFAQRMLRKESNVTILLNIDHESLPNYFDDKEEANGDTQPG